MKYAHIILEQEGPVAVLSINRPEKRNAMNLATRRELSAALDAVAADGGIKVLVVTGAGEKAFIAGSDLTEFGRLSPLEFYEFGNTYGQRLYTRLEELPIPVIAMVNGMSFGGGLEVALACDFRIASENAVFGQVEILRGIMPSSGGTQRLPRLVGSGRARQMIFTGEILSAEEALRIGLVNRVVPLPELRSTVLGIAGKIAGNGSISLQMAKKALLMSEEVGLRAGLAYETLCQTACFTSPDREEGMASFFEKRPAVFTDANPRF